VDPSEHRFLFEQGARDWWQVGMRACTLAVLPAAARSGRALDLGAGCGWFVRELGPGAHGVELSEDAVAFAAEAGADVEHGRIEDVLPAEGLELVSCLDVLPHREVDEPAVLRDAGASLAPGGRLLLRLPAFQRLYGAHDRFVHQVRRYDRSDVPALHLQPRMAGACCCASPPSSASTALTTASCTRSAATTAPMSPRSPAMRGWRWSA